MNNFLVWLIASFISTFGYLYLYYKLIDDSKIGNIKVVIIYVLGSFAVTFIEYFNLGLLRYFFFFMYFPILFLAIKKVKLNKLIFYLIIIWLYGIILDLALIFGLSIFSFILEVDIYNKYKNVVSIILSLLITFILIFICNHVNIKNFTNTLYKKIVNIKYINYTLIAFSLFIMVVGLIIFYNMGNLSITFLLSLVIILIVIMFILLIKTKINEEEMSKYLATLKKNNEFYIQVEDENRIFKHNLVAKLLSIKSVSNVKSQELIDDLINEYNKNINFSSKIKGIPYGFDGIIYQKIYSLKNELEIKIYNDIDYDIFEVLKPRRYNVLVEKMIIALDNAIESALNSREKVLVINLYDENNCIVIEIKNTFSNAINLDELGQINYSTKGKIRGFGLFSALRNTEASLNISIVNDFFISKISAKKQKN